MKKRQFSCIKDYCESCAHIMAEKNEYPINCDYSCLSMDITCNHAHSKLCKSCGQAINDNQFQDDVKLLDSALSNKKLKVICFTAPSVRVALGDEFQLPVGTNVQGRMVSALKELGFHAVFDMNTAADFTIIEEANEFVNRLKTNKKLPMFTSCCPGWVSYCKKLYPKFVKNLSTCKSPQQMFGAMINNIYANQNKFESTDMFVVSIVPCLAKKLELRQEGMNTNVGLDVDVAISTKELASLIKSKGIDFVNLKEQDYDQFFGSSSGAGAIFGNTGGVMEAVLRTVDSDQNKVINKIEYKMVRGLKGIRKATINIGGRDINLAVVTGLKNIKPLMDEIILNPSAYDFIEVMACEGGCIGGGGQPRVKGMPLNEVLKARSNGLYSYEKTLKCRKAHDNDAVKDIYKKYLGKVGGKEAKRLLHVHRKPKKLTK